MTDAGHVAAEPDDVAPARLSVTLEAEAGVGLRRRPGCDGGTEPGRVLRRRAAGEDLRRAAAAVDPEDPQASCPRSKRDRGGGSQAPVHAERYIRTTLRRRRSRARGRVLRRAEPLLPFARAT